jgi:hypothetical protein
MVVVPYLLIHETRGSPVFDRSEVRYSGHLICDRFPQVNPVRL